MERIADDCRDPRRTRHVKAPASTRCVTSMMRLTLSTGARHERRQLFLDP
jgi:hypothetical protein